MASTSACFSFILVFILASNVWAQSEEVTGEESEPTPSSSPVQASPDPYWEVQWNNTGFVSDGGLIGGDGGVFAVPGQIIPGVDVPTIIDVAARSWNSDTLKQSVGEICVAFGPIASQFLGTTVQDVCIPVLESLRSGEPVQGVNEVCQELWMAEEEEEYEPNWDNWYQIPVSPDDEGSQEPDVVSPGFNDQARDFWDIPSIGYFYPSQFLQEVLGFSDDNQYETCSRLGAVVYNRSLSGRELVRNITSTALKRLLPLSLLSCDESGAGSDVHLGTVLLQMFSALSERENTQQFCDFAEGLAERNGQGYDQLVAVSTNALLTALIDDASKCTDLVSRLEEQGLWMGFHTEIGYESIDMMCSNIQDMLQNPDTDFLFSPDDEELQEMVASDVTIMGFKMIKVVRAAGGFLNSGTVREGFVGLCRSLSRVSSSADDLMCAALEMDTSSELIRQCLALCGLHTDEGSDVPGEGSGGSRDPQEGSGGSRDPPEGSGGSRDPPEGSGGSRDPPEGSGGSRVPPEGSGGSRDPPEGSGGSRNPSEGSGGSRDPPEESGGSRDPPEGSGGSRDPPEGSGGSRGPPEGSGGSRVPPEGSGGSRVPPEGSGGSRDPPEGSGGYRDPSEGSGGYRDPSEGSGGYRDPSEGSGGSRDPPGGSGGSRNPSEGSGGSRDPPGGSGGSRNPSHGSSGSRDPSVDWDEMEASGYIPYFGDGYGNRDPEREPGDPRGPTEGSGDSREREEGSGGPRGPGSGFGYPRDPEDGSGDVFGVPDGDAWWYSTNFFGPWVGFSHEELLRTWFSEWFEIRGTDDEEQKSFPLPGLKHLLEDILGIHDADSESICQRFGWKIHENSMTVRDIFIKILDNTLEYLAYSAPDLCGDNPMWHPPPMGVNDLPIWSSGDGDYPMNSPRPYEEDSDNPMNSSPEQHDGQRDEQHGHPGSYDGVTDRPNWFSARPEWEKHEEFPSTWENGHLGPLSGEVVAKLFAFLGGYDSKEEMCRDARSEYYFDSISGRVIRMRRKLLEVTWNENVCVDVLRLINTELHLFGDFSIHFANANSMCAEIKYAYGPHNTESLRDIFMEDADVDMRGFLLASGKLFNTTIRDAALIPCDILSGTQLDSLEMERECSLLSDPDPAWLIEECIEFFNDGQWLLDVYNFDNWWPSFIPSWDKPWTSQMNGWFDGIIHGDVATLFYNLFADNPKSSPEAICLNAERFVANRTLTMQFMFDEAMDATLRFFAHASPELCKKDRGDGNWTEEYSTDYLGAIFTFLGHYENSDELCRDSVGAVSEGADPSRLDDIVTTMKQTIYGLMRDVDVCETFMDIMQETSETPFSVGDLGFESNRMFCEAVNYAFDPAKDIAIDISALERLIRSGEDMENGWGLLQPDLLQLVGHLFNAGTFKDVVEESCKIFNQTDQIGFFLGDDFYPLCRWANKPHDRDEFIGICLTTVELPWESDDGIHDSDDTPDSDSRPMDDDEILGLLRFILGNEELTYTGFVSWVQEMFGLDISTDEQLCGSARDMISNEDVTIPVIVDTVMDVAIRLLGKASPWLCAQGRETTTAPTPMPGFNSSQMPQWAESMMETMDMTEVDPFTVLGDVFSFLGNYQNSDELCRDSLEAVAEGADPALLDDMVNKFKAAMYSLLNDADHCTSFVDLMQDSLDIPFSVGDIIGFGSNRGLCEAIGRAFDPQNIEEIDLSILRTIIYPEPEDSGTSREEMFAGESGDGEDAPIIPEEWQIFIREMLKVAGRLYNSGTITQAIGTTCGFLDQADINIESLVPEIGQVCDWSRRGSDLGEFYQACVDFIELPWDESPDDGSRPWEDDEYDTDEEILGWLGAILGNDDLSYSDFVSWVQEVFGLDISTDEQLCGSARDMISNEDVTIPVIVDTVMDVAIRLLGKASPWLCGQGRDTTTAPTPMPGFNSSQMPQWAESMMETMDMTEVDPFTVLGDVFSFLGNYQNSDELCRDSLEAVAEGADPALLDDMVNKFKAAMYSLLNDADHCTSFVDLMQDSLDIPFSVGDIIGFGSNRGLCEAIGRAFDPQNDEEIDLSILRTIIYPEPEDSGTNREEMFAGESGDGEDEPIIPEEWQIFIREMLKVAGRLYNSGTITQAIGTTCGFLDQADINIESLVPEIGQVCDWSRRGSDLGEFYQACVDFIELPWDESPDDGSRPWEDDEYDTDEEILGWLGAILGNDDLSYSDFVSWVQEVFGLDISTDEQLCGSARDMISNEDVTIPVIVDTVMDVAIRLLGKASPWLCAQGRETTTAPTPMPGFNSSQMPQWAESMMETMDMTEVDPFTVLGDVFSFLGNYQNTDELCRDSLEAVAEGADPALLDDMVNKFKAAMYSLLNDADHCTSFVDLMQDSLDIPFSVGDIIGFGSNRGLCEAIGRAFDPQNDEEIDLSILRTIIYPEPEDSGTRPEDMFAGESGDGEDAPIIPEEWQIFIREMLKVAGRLYNSGTITQAIGTTCGFLDQADINIESLVPEIGQVCDWSRRGSDLGEFYQACVDFIELPWDESPDDGSRPWEDDEYDTDEEILGWLGAILGNDDLSYSDFVSWVQEVFGLDISTDEQLCGSARDMISNEDVTIPVIVDTVMDVAIRLLGKASPWLCAQGRETTTAPTPMPGFNSSQMPQWAESMMETMDMTEVDPFTVLGDVFSFLGNYQNTDELCRDSLEAVAEGADPALLDDMVNKFKAAMYSLLNDADHCTSFVDLMQDSLDIPFSVGDIIGFGSNRGLCEAIGRAFDPQNDEEIDLSILRTIIYPEPEDSGTRPEEMFAGESGDGEDAPIIPEEWQIFIREMLKVAGRLYNSGTITQAIGTTCGFLDQADINIESLVPEIGQVCDWSRRGSDLGEFYQACVDFIELPWDESPDDGSRPWEDDEYDTDEEILGWLGAILGNDDLSYSDFVSWVQEVFGLDISTDEQLCGSARDMISNEDVTIPVIVDTVMDVAIRLLGKASPWLCAQGRETTTAPTPMPGFNSSQMPQWAESMMETMDMTEVDPFTVLGDVFSFLGNYQNTDELCRDSLEAVAEGADPALLDDMVNKFKAAMYSLLNDADHCTSFVDLMQDSLDIPFSVGDIIGFGSNRGLCEAIGRAFDPQNDEEIDLSILRTIIYPEPEDSGTRPDDMFAGESGDGEDAPIIPEEWQIFIREMLKVAGRLYNSGTITQAIGTTCGFLDQADINIESLVPEIGQVCDWSRRGSDLGEFYQACVDFIELPWDESPDDGSRPWEDDEYDTDEEILGWLGAILGNDDLSYSDFVSWVQEVFGLDISTDEQLCGSARDMISNEDVTIPVIVDTVMDVAIRLLGKASPWLCAQGRETTTAPTPMPGFNSSQMPQWAESMMETMDMTEVDPFTVLGDVFSFLGNYQNTDELCRDALEAVAEGADPALLDDMVNKFKAAMYSLLNDADHCTSFVDLMQDSLDIPFSVGDIIGFGSNRGLCEAIGRAFDPQNDEEIDLSILRTIIYPEPEDSGTRPDDMFAGESGDGEDAPIIPEEWQIFIREMLKVAGRLYNSGTITQAIGTTCGFLDQADINIESLVPEIGQVCDWSRRGSDLGEFYQACVDFIELPWDESPDDGSRPWEDDEYDTDEEILGWLGAILGNDDLSYSDFVSWVQEVFGLDISTDEQLCGSARDMISNEDVTIPVIVDTVMDVAIRLLGKASPWLCAQGRETTTAPTPMPGFNSSQMPQWAESMMETMDMTEVDPFTVLGDVFSFLGNYQNTDELCRDSLEAVAEGADPALLDDMVNKFKAAMYSLLNDADHCTSFVDLMQDSLDIPFSVGDIIGFGSNRGLCEAIGRAFDPQNDEEIDLSILRTIIYPEPEDSGTRPEEMFAGESGDGEDAPIIPEEWQIFIREMLKVAGRLYNSGTITQAIGTTCGFLDQADINIESLVPEIGQVCDWSRRGSDLGEFYQACVDFIELPWDESPDDGSRPWEDDEYDTDEEILGWLGAILGNDDLSYSDFVSWVQEVFGLDISTDEQLCGSARDMISNEDVTIPVIVDTVMDVAIRLLGKASPWLCAQGRETTTAPTPMPGFNSSQMPQWAESMMETMDMTEVDPFTVLGDVFSFLGNYQNTDELCRDSLEAVAEGADPALLDDMVNKFKAAMYSLLNDADHCTSFVDLMQDSLDIPFSVGDIIGFGSNRGLCEAIGRAFDPQNDEEIDLSILRTIIYPEPEDSGTSPEEMFAGESGDGEDAPIIPEEWQIFIREMLKVAGRLYNSGTITQAIGTTCGFLDQADINIESLVPEIGQVCDWSRRGSDLGEFYQACVDFIELPWDNTPECKDGWWATFLFQAPFDFAQGEDDTREEDDIRPDDNQNTDVSLNSGNSMFQSIGEIIYYRLGIDPYTACETFGSVLQADTVDVLEFGKSAARTLFSSVFPEETLSAKCMQYYRNATSPNFNPPGFTVFNDTERLLSDLAGKFQNGSDFCNYILSFGVEERREAVLSAVVEGAFNSMNDISLCNSSVYLLLGNYGIEAFRQITDFETVPGFCGYLYDSFNDRVNATNFEVQLPDEFDLTNYTPEGGELLPGVAFRDIVSFAGALLTTNKFKDSLNMACDALAPLFDDSVFQGFGHFASICNAINGNDTQAAVLQCEQLLVPQAFGEDYPINLRHVDVGQVLLEIVLPYFNYEPRFEKDVICPAIETVLNSDTSPKEMATLVINGMLRTGITYGAGICQEMEKVFNYLAPDDDFFSGPSDPNYHAEFQRTFYGTFAFASTMAGFDNSDLMCDALIDAVGDQETFDNLVDLLRERAFSYLTDEAECKIAVESLMRFINLMSSDTQAANLLFQVTGYYSPMAFCIASTAAFRGESSTDEVCFGIVDCAGVCNGDAVYDCDGVCGGSAERDCANMCNGGATLNTCNRCVGGITGRGDNFGLDQCGTCLPTSAATDYRITWDCHETCNGTAFVDTCKECVGGETGKSADYNQWRIDCRGICNGGWREDSCGFCEPFDESSLGVANKYLDCNGECFTPGASSNRAQLNHCGICYGGTTGLNETSGVNACGQCLTDSFADESSCAGCDGVPNSGTENDACGICGGTGTTCFGVGWVVPSLVSENSNTQLEVYGAGFEEGSSLICIFEDAAGTQTQSDSQYGDYVRLTCNVPGLAAGDYKVKVERDGIISDSVYAELTVEPEIEILTISPSELTINSSAQSVSLTVTASENAFTSVKAAGVVPSLIVEGDFNAVVPGSFDDASDSIMYFPVPMPSRSAQVTVFPSLNGVEKLMTTDGAGFQLTAYAPAPEFTAAYFASTGAAVVIRFSSGVNFDELSGCDDVFEDTTKLGNSAFCRWVGSTAMYIILGTGSDLLGVGDELVIKSDTVKAFRETHSRYVAGSQTLAGPTNPVVPTVVLYGKERITSCGTVRLTGRQTQGGAGRDMAFTWAVTSEGETASVEDVVTGESGVDLSVPGSMMDAETVYTFSLTAQNFLGETDTSYINASRSALAVPEVEITVRGVDPDNVLVSNSFALTAEVTFYSDCVPPGETVFSWSVDNDDVPLNLKTINRRTLHVDPNTLPGDTTVTFTVLIYKSSDPNSNVSQSFSVQTKYSDLVPIIYGGSELTVGRGSGQLILDGSGSFDLDQVATDMVYEWQCSQVTDNTACWSFKEGEEGTQFPSADAASMSLLAVSASAMEADKTYEFTLVVSKLTRSASTSVRVTALNGDPPKVEISTVLDERILAENSLSLMAAISHDLILSSYVWETVGEDEGYAYLDLSDVNNLDGPASLYPYSKSNGSISFITIKAGKLTAGSTYQIQLTATTADGQYGIAKIQFTVVAGVTSCVFSLNGASSYTELSSIVYTIDNCVADESAYPLSYRVFLVDGSRKQTITEKTNNPAIDGVGKSLTDESSATNTFVAEVCDAYESCTYFYLTVDVDELSQCTAESLLQLVDNLVTVEKYKQNYANALVNYNEVQAKCANSTSARRRRRSVTVTTSYVAEEQLSLLQSNIDSSVLDTNSAQLLIDQCSYINTDDLSLSDKTVFIDILVELVAVFEAAGEPCPADSATVVLDKATEIRRSLNTTYHSSILATITSLTDSLSQAQINQLQLGAAALETASSTLTSSVQRAIPTGTFYSKSTGGHSIDFGTVLSNTFSADWACSSGTCSGATVSFDHWETGQDEFSLSDEDRANVAADITDIKLLDPSSGEELSIANLTERITITMTVSQPQAGKTYECRYWNTDSLAWASDGVETVPDPDNSSVVECLTDHLTAFTLYAVDSATTEVPTGVAADQTTQAYTATGNGGTTEQDEPIEVPQSGDSSSTVIIVVVCVVVVVVALVFIAVVLVVKAKKTGKVAAADPNGNVADEETPRQPEETVPAVAEQWASQRPVTPRRSPTPQQTAPPPPQQTTTVQVVAVPMALQTVPLNTLPPPSSPHMLVADMDDAVPPPVYIPPTQNMDMDTTAVDLPLVS